MKYRVLHTFSSYTMGGAEKSTLFLADCLQKSGQIENFLAVPKDSFLFKQASEKNIEAIHFKARGCFAPNTIYRLISIVKKHKINIIHVHQGKLYWTALIAKLFCPKVKVVFHRRQDTRHKVLSTKHYYFADAVITVSKAVADGLIKYEKVDPSKIKVVYNGVNFEKFNINTDYSGIIKEFELENKIVAGAVGAIVDLKGKGQIFLIEAAKHMKEKHPRLRYLIVGDGAGLEELKEYTDKLGVSDIVHFAGYRDDVQKLILAMDIFCILSWDTEGMPNVLIEAQALEKPVIATNVGGTAEAFIDGQTGIKVRTESVSDIVDAIEKYLTDPKMAKQFGIAGKKFVEEKFTIEKMISNTIEVYNKIMVKK